MNNLTERYRQMVRSNIANRMMHGAFWSFTGTALGKFFILLSGIICARILGKELFGELGMIRSTIGMFIIFGAGGIGVTATRYISSYREGQKAHAASIYRLSTWFSAVLGLVTTLLLLLCTDFLANDILQSQHLALPLAIGCIILLLSILNSSENGTLAGLEDFKAIAVNTLIGSIAEAVLMIVGAWFYQVEGAIAGLGIGILVLYLTNRRSAWKGLKAAGIPTKGQTVWKEDWKLLYTYSIPATLSALTVTPVFWLIRSMLVRAEHYGELGVFEAADQWKVIILFIPGTICQIVLPIMSSITDARVFRRTLMGNLALIGGVSAVLALVTWAAAPVIMPLYGKTFTDMAPLTYLALSTIPTALTQILEMTLYSRDKMWTCLVFNLIWGVSAVVLSHFLLLSHLGASGIALAVLVAYLVKMGCMGGYMLLDQRKGGLA
ncbi:MAG: oligosaccharide flippase family protein [Bacteroidales bacterium]|nr:oligosaccharide flippase family protein [Bacillota bacterium]MBQ2566492.1 oligosaccharide flippase family protein [Bacteroidales bacterium]